MKTDKNTMKHFLKTFMHSETGVSLVATALFIAVFGILSVTVLQLVSQRSTLERNEEAKSRTTQIENALARFASDPANGRYPCPAQMTAALDTANFGVEISGNCATSTAIAGNTWVSQGVDGQDVHMGALPVRSLNLPDDFIVDAWGHRYLYAVTEVLASPGANLGGDDGDISIYDIQAFNNDASTDSDEDKRKKYSLSTSPGSAHYAIISSGGDSRGAYSLDGALIEACEAGTNAEENCDMNDAVFTTTLEKSFGLGSNTFSHSLAFRSSITQFQWFAGGFGACTNPGGASCTVPGSGEQTRTVECRALDGTPANDSQCNGVRPSTTQPCTMACLWGAGTYGACDAICNGGTQTAPAQCYDIDGTSTVANGNCDAGTNPGPFTRACNTGNCAWQSVFGACSVSCGGGTQPISGQCTNPNAGGANVSGVNCLDPEPSGTQACNTHNCPINGSCGSSNGGFFSSRPSSGLCSRGTASGVSGSGPWSWSCNGLYGGSSASCSASISCPVTSWSPSTGSRCSGVSFTQTRTESNCSAGSRPATGTQSAGSWSTSGWSGCSASCGGGTQTRSVSCTASCGCSGSAPSSIQACNTHSCCSTRWSPSTGSVCSGDRFTQTERCSGATRSATGTRSCPPPPSWQTGSWNRGNCVARAPLNRRGYWRNVYCSSGNDSDCGGGRPRDWEARTDSSCGAPALTWRSSSSAGRGACPSPNCGSARAGRSCSSNGALCTISAVAYGCSGDPIGSTGCCTASNLVCR